MKRKRIVRTAEVTIEIEETTNHCAGEPSHSTLLRCPSCGRHVEMVTPEEAAEIAGVTERTIYRWCEAAIVHFAEEAGHLWICVPALSRRKKSQLIVF